MSVSIESAVKEALDSIEFEKVGDLTKEQFAEILTKAITKSTRTRDFINTIARRILP